MWRATRCSSEVALVYFVKTLTDNGRQRSTSGFSVGRWSSVKADGLLRHEGQLFYFTRPPASVTVCTVVAGAALSMVASVDCFCN